MPPPNIMIRISGSHQMSLSNFKSFLSLITYLSPSNSTALKRSFDPAKLVFYFVHPFSQKLQSFT